MNKTDKGESTYSKINKLIELMVGTGHTDGLLGYHA